MTTDKFDRKMAAVLQQADVLRRQFEAGEKMFPKDIFDALIETLEELHVAQEELTQSNNELAESRLQLEIEKYRYQELFQFAPDGYLVTNPRGIILEANSIAAKLLNYAPAHLVGKPVSVFLPQDEVSEFRTRLNHLAESDRISDWETTFVSRNDRAFPVSITVVTICDRSEKTIGLRWTFRDISESVGLRIALEKLNNELEERVADRTHQLQVMVGSMAGREVRMADLKQVIKKLRTQIEQSGAVPIANDPLLEPSDLR